MLGQKLFKADNTFNELVRREEIKRYVWYSETRQPFSRPDSHNEFLLGKFNNAVYYFLYDEDSETTLNFNFLSTMDPGFRGDQYIIYADNCLLPEAFMQNKGIVFKKIPRDITKF